jgi:hypothetical protein
MYKENRMKTLFTQFAVQTTRLDTRYLRLILVLVSLALFVLGAGAPEMGGGHGG